MSQQKLIINLSFLMRQPTGISSYAFNLLPQLRPVSPTLLISQPLSSYDCYKTPPGQTPEQGLRGHLRRLLWTQLQLPKIYQQLKSQLLFSPIPEAPLNSNCRYIVMVHDLIPLRFPKPNSPLTPYFRYYIPQILTQAQHILCNSTATARDITDFYHIPATKITPIPLAYDTNHFRPLCAPLRYPLRPSAFPKQPHEATSANPYFLYIGRHDPYKNLHRLINAFATLPNSRDYELWIAGSSDKRYTPKLQAQANHLGLSHQIKFLNYVPYNQLPILLNNAIALIFPSLWEGFGLPVLEAMACGTPVITSNLSALPEVAGDAAILVNPYNTLELSAAMHSIATDSQLRSRLSTLGLQRARQFSWAKTGQQTVEVLGNYL
ncbi:MAG: glycosyltransferase family 4 protein [Coleofasciculus sp.]|uniref:glycosyltransferase family 4 protein n=1 Tax=Coleofasciculus sp. TaxID=3100458 RepID=UPI003A20B60A